MITELISLIFSVLIQAQIQLIGNFVTWTIANLMLVVYCLLFLTYLLRRRRKVEDIPQGMCLEVLLHDLR